jgi:hypothetical protein
MLDIFLMPKSGDRATIVAKHPAAVARFFNKMITTVLDTLIAYNVNKHASYKGGGIFGQVSAYYGTVEESGRGALHLHMLIWLANSPNPADLRRKIQDEV